MKHCFESAYAKINITLDVLGRREDGYHELRMIMQTVSLRDMIAVRIGCGGNEIRTVSNLGYLPDDDRNIVVKAAHAFFEVSGVVCDGVHIAIEKRIPVAAGLGGGSSNGAAVLRALNRLYKTNLTIEELCDIGLKIGADVPFCIHGGTMLAEGIGEVLTKLPDMPECYVVLCKPGFGMSTAQVYGALNSNEIKQHPDTTRICTAIEKGDLREIAENMYNVLEEVVSKERSEIAATRAILMKYGALGSLMSGSGSTTFGIFNDMKFAEAAYKKLKSCYRDTFFAKTCILGM